MHWEHISNIISMATGYLSDCVTQYHMSTWNQTNFTSGRPRPQAPSFHWRMHFLHAILKNWGRDWEWDYKCVQEYINEVVCSLIINAMYTAWIQYAPVRHISHSCTASQAILRLVAMHWELITPCTCTRSKAISNVCCLSAQILPDLDISASEQSLSITK